jgi:hypothetical protein
MVSISTGIRLSWLKLFVDISVPPGKYLENIASFHIRSNSLIITIIRLFDATAQVTSSVVK